MELSSEVVAGLQISSDATRITDEDYDFLLKESVDGLLYRKEIGDDGSYGSVDPASWKQAFASVITLFLEAAKNDLTSLNLRSFLEDQNYSSERITQTIKIYEKEKTNVRKHLSSVTHCPPHIVDVDWRLDQCFKDSDLGRIGKPQFFVSLKTELPNESRDINFCCTLDQMQDLVSKLKDACKCLEKNSQNVT